MAITERKCQYALDFFPRPNHRMEFQGIIHYSSIQSVKKTHFDTCSGDLESRKVWLVGEPDIFLLGCKKNILNLLEIGKLDF